MAGQRIGSLWKGNKAVATGTLDLLGMRVRVAIFKNEQQEGKQPDYNVVSYGLDERQQEQSQQSPPVSNDDNCPF